MFTLLSAILSGCRTHEYYEYKSVRKELMGGSFYVYVRSKKEDFKEGRKKLARHGFPYTLVIGFSAPKSDGPDYEHWKTFVVRNIIATGKETGKRLTFDGGEESFSRIGTSGFGFSITENMGLTYEPFDIEADVKIIHTDGTEQSEHIKVRLEKDYKKKRQSDTWDYLRSM